MSLRSRLTSWTQTSRFAPFIPKLVVCLLEGYPKQKFAKDLFSGVTMGVIALPISMAIAIGAGTDPKRGIQTAIVGGLLTSLFGGSRFLIGGPAGAFVILMYSIIQRFGIEGLLCATLQASLILMVLGFFRCGGLVRLFSYPVIMGFTTGIGCTLLLSQINDLLGLTGLEKSADTIDRLQISFSHITATNFYAVGISLGTIVLISALKKVSPRFPNVIVALIIVTATTYFFNLPVETIFSKFGGIPDSLPSPHLPDLSIELLRKTFPDAISIALLCAIESLLTCVIADSLTGTRHKSNCELVGQGIANFGSVLYGGLPSAGLIARTSANIQLDAQTPVSGIVHSFSLLLLLLLFAPLASCVPLAALSSVLVVVAVKMIEFDQLRQIARSGFSEAAVMLATFLITVLVDINTAVEVGVFLTVILFIKRSTEASTVSLLSLEKEDKEVPDDESGSWHMSLPSDTKVYEIEGPLFFAVANMLFEAFHLFEKKPKTLILRMRAVPFVDSTGADALRRFAKQCESQDIALFFVELRPNVLEYLEQTGFFETVDKDRVVPSVQKALLCATTSPSI